MTTMTKQLKMETKSFHTVDYGDLEEYILAVTGHEYEIPCMEETSNDSSLTFTVQKFDNSNYDAEYTAKYDIPEWNTFKTTGKIEQWRLGLILNGLATDGHIPEGEYIVEISW